MLTPATIANCAQNQPELIVRDAKNAFGLTDEQCDNLRQILLARGVNKWFYARRLCIDLKHEMKKFIRSAEYNALTKEIKRKILRDYISIKKACCLPRYIEWPKQVHHSQKNAEKEIIVRRA